jgi:hypothetical protein
MRYLRSHEIGSMTVDQALEQFVERREKSGFRTEADLVSVSVRPYDESLSVLRNPDAPSAVVIVTFVYWSDLAPMAV